MDYNVWIEPYMPSIEERDPKHLYAPQEHLYDARLSDLDNSVYIYLCVKEQIYKEKYKSIQQIVEDIKVHPDKYSKALYKYLKQTGMKINELTDKEWKMIPVIPVTYEDIKESLIKLAKLGYIELSLGPDKGVTS